MDRQQDGGTAALTQYTWERQPEAERLARESAVQSFDRASALLGTGTGR